jgi:hypothetical protein
MLPESFRVIIVGEPSLICDNKDAENRMMIFATKEFLGYLLSSNTRFADGTFKTAPQLFQQLFTIHFLRNSKAYPAVYALLSNKLESTYVEMLQKLKIIDDNLNPDTVITDFEKASINAFKTVFPDIKNKGCFFACTYWIEVKV